MRLQGSYVISLQSMEQMEAALLGAGEGEQGAGAAYREGRFEDFLMVRNLIFNLVAILTIGEIRCSYRE